MRADERMNPAEAIRWGLEVLHHNSSLVQFADQKAATLIVVNSVFIASASSSSPFWRLVLLLLSGVALLLCLAVVVMRRSAGGKGDRSPVFFGDIVKWKSPQAYLAELLVRSHAELAEGVAASIHRTCAIAERKYSCYEWALRLTMVASGVWLAGLVFSIVR